MIVVFENKSLELLYTQWIWVWYHPDIISWYIRKITFLMQARDERDLKNFQSLGFEKLRSYPKWGYSIRINKKRRIVFDIIYQGKTKIINITELSNHYQ